MKLVKKYVYGAHICLSRIGLLGLVVGMCLGCSSSGSNNDSTEAETEWVAPDAQNNSTALSERQAPEAFSFSSYQNVSLSIDLSDYSPEMAGTTFVVKVSDEELNTMYVSAHQANDLVNISFSAPSAQQSAWLEIYTDAENQAAVLEEISL